MITTAAILILASAQSVQCVRKDYNLIDDMSKFIIHDNGGNLSKMYREPAGRAIVSLNFNDKGKLVELKIICSTSKRFEKVALRYVKITKFDIPSTAKRTYRMAITVVDAAP